MAGSGGAGYCTICLPLVLECKETIQQDGVKAVAKDLKQHLELFQRHILCWKEFSYVRVKDVTTKSDIIYLTFEFNQEDSLDAFYACTKDASNEFAQCISVFFDEQSFEWVAGLGFGTKIACKLQMTKREYLKAQYDMCAEEPYSQRQSPKDDQKTEHKTNVHYEVVTEDAEIRSVSLS